VSASKQTPRPRPIARLALAALFVAMAAGQLSNLPGFIDIVASYGVGGTSVAGIAAAALITGELTAAVGLVSRDHTRRSQAASVAVAVALAWSVLAVQAFARGIALDNCGCFGVHAGQSLRWWVLIEDLELLALAWWVHANAARAAAAPRSTMVESAALAPLLPCSRESSARVAMWTRSRSTEG
jgi:hypothetical protein